MGTNNQNKLGIFGDKSPKKLKFQGGDGDSNFGEFAHTSIRIKLAIVKWYNVVWPTDFVLLLYNLLIDCHNSNETSFKKFKTFDGE